MSIELRTVVVEEMREVMVCNGGSCEHTAPAPTVPEGWIAVSINVPLAFKDKHFCSYRCLAEWAQRHAEKAE